MERRLKVFALRVLRLTRALPQTYQADVIGKQLFRCATSVASNYRAAGRGRSKAEFVAKLGIVEEEADESCFWLELVIDDGMLQVEQVQPLLGEASEICAMVVASRRAAKAA